MGAKLEPRRRVVNLHAVVELSAKPGWRTGLKFQ